jgi:hypothetical protein
MKTRSEYSNNGNPNSRKKNSLEDGIYASPSGDEDDDDEEVDQMPRQRPPVAVKSPGKLFESLNLTNLNVSFNSSSMAEAKRRLEESRTQALLVKSFAYNKKGGGNITPKEKTDKDDFADLKSESSEAEVDQRQQHQQQQRQQLDEEEEEEEVTPRSSNLYQTESEDEEVVEADDSEDEEGNDNDDSIKEEVIKDYNSDLD